MNAHPADSPPPVSSLEPLRDGPEPGGTGARTPLISLCLIVGNVEEYIERCLESFAPIADEIVVDLMHSASGVDYAGAEKDIVIRDVGGVSIPFASPELLWRMKRTTHREKDKLDLVFLRQVIEAAGGKVPE